MTKTRTSAIILFLCIISNLTQAQYWHSYNPTSFFDINTVDIVNPGTIAIGGGWETNDSTQVMFQTTDYGLTWLENTHDGLAPWNKSIAFSDQTNGFGAGFGGRIIKTNDAGKNWGWPSTPINRDFNKIIYAGNATYYVAGGRKTNSSMQTILKSSDNGNTWNKIYDAPGPWLKSICFKDALHGFAVGDNGVILSTSDGGNSWTSVTPPVVRDFNAIKFINASKGFIIGGSDTGQGSRTILKTLNGGTTWSVLMDETGGILKDISFADSLVGYIVGDSATVLKTTNSGINWLPIVINANLTGNESFNAVKFSNQNFGVIGGKAGALFVYNMPFPLVHTSMASEIKPNSARLNGSIDAGGFPTAVKFEYGTTTTYGNEIVAIPDTSSIAGNVSVSALSTDLLPNTVYHYRTVGTTQIVTNYGNDMTFYTGNPEIPNFDFEHWTLHTFQKPTGWDDAVGLVTQYTPACYNNSAVKIMNDTTDPGMMGGILIGKSYDQGHTFVGGAPFNARPDSLTGCFNYAIPANDTALILLILKNQGVVISNNLFKIYGNSAGNYANLNFPISYTSAGNADSLIIVITVTDIRHMTHPLLANSYLIVDNIRFIGTSVNIPDNDFENWTVDSLYYLDSWYYKHQSYIHYPVSRTTDAENGNFAVVIQNILTLSDSTTGLLSTGNPQVSGSRFSVNARYKALTGYYKFMPENNDTLSINISMFKNHNFVGTSYFYTGDTVSDYKPFVININYLNTADFNETDIPDSCMIIIQSFKNKPRGNSLAYIDNLNFDGFLAGIKEPSIIAGSDNLNYNIYPNPFNEQATIAFTINQDEKVLVRLFDLSGKQVALLADGKYTAGSHSINLSAQRLQKGYYICVINTEKDVYSKKLIVF